MHYMLLIYGDPAADVPPASPADAFARFEDATAALDSDGALVAGDRLHPADSATTVMFRAGETLLTDGPFVETKEQLLGYYLIDVSDLDAALAWARRLPVVSWGAIEVRPVDVGPPSAPLTRDRAG